MAGTREGARKRSEATKQDRRKRTPLGVQRKSLSLDEKTLKALNGRVPRWVNDDNHGQRISAALEGGYNFIESTGTEMVGDTVKSEESDRRIRKLVGTHKDNSPKYAYLMAIEKEFYDEDQARKEAENAKVDQTIKGGQPRGINDHGISPDQGRTFVKNVEYQP
jgi:hypothetical protein